LESSWLVGSSARPDENQPRSPFSRVLTDPPGSVLSALTDSRDKMRAFEAGGVDYITKPFYEAEVRARVRAQLALRRNQLHLEELVRCRTAELGEAHHRLQVWDDAKTNWLNALSHELRTPLTGIIGTAEVLFSQVKNEDEMNELHDGYQQAVQRIGKLIDDAMLLTQIDVAAQTFSAFPITVHALLTEIVCRVQHQFPKIRFETQLAAQIDTVDSSFELMQKALEDFLMTAQYCALEGETVSIETEAGAGRLRIDMQTNGQPLPEKDLESFFEVGGQRTILKGGGDFGLGPALAARIIKLFDGEVSVANGKETGVCITVELPLAE